MTRFGNSASGPENVALNGLLKKNLSNISYEQNKRCNYLKGCRRKEESTHTILPRSWN